MRDKTNKAIEKKILTEYCNVCGWKGTQEETCLSFTEFGNVSVHCPKCEADITAPANRKPRPIGVTFFLYLLGGILAILLYLIVQSFITVVWICSAGRSESPLIFHQEVKQLLKKLPETY